MYSFDLVYSQAGLETVSAAFMMQDRGAEDERKKRGDPGRHTENLT